MATDSSDTGSSLRAETRAGYDAESAAFATSRRKAVWPEFEQLRPLIEQAQDRAASESRKLAILDAGCGSGRLFRFLQEKEIAAEYFGFDFSAGLLAEARRQFPAGRFEQADLVEFKSEPRFDLAVSIAVLHHLAAKKEQLAALQNLFDSLRPGGELFLTSWNLWQPRFWPAQIRALRNGEPRVLSIPFRSWQRRVFALRAGELARLARLAGFQAVEVSGRLKPNLVLTARKPA